MFNKKIVYSTKVEEGCLILRNIILCATYSFFLLLLARSQFHFLNRTRDFLYQLMSVDSKSVPDCTNHTIFLNNRYLSC